VPHFGSPLEPSLVPIPITAPSFPQPTFPTGPTFGGDFGGGGFTDPGARGPGGGPLGTPAAPIDPLRSLLPTGGLSEEEFLREQNLFIRNLILSAQQGGSGPRPVNISQLPFDLVPVPGATPGSDLVPIPEGTPIPLFGPFVPPPAPVAARASTPAVSTAQQQAILESIISFFLQLFGPRASGSTPRAAVGVVGGASAPGGLPTRFPFPTSLSGGAMPNVSTSFLGDFDFGGLLTTGLGILGDILAPRPTAQRPLVPTVARPIQTQLRPQPVGFVGDALSVLPDVLPFIDIVAQGSRIGPPGATCIVPTLGPTRATLPQRVDVPTTDASGNMRFTTYKNMGRAILFAGDFAAVKRVRKVASKARRATGGR